MFLSGLSCVSQIRLNYKSLGLEFSEMGGLPKMGRGGCFEMGGLKPLRTMTTQVLFFNMKSIDSKIKGILNLGWISASYFNKKYLTTSTPKVCGMFVYRPTA